MNRTSCKTCFLLSSGCHAQTDSTDFPANASEFWRFQSRSWISKSKKNRIMKSCMHSSVDCGIICDSQDTEAAQVAINWWMDKVMWCRYVKMEYYSHIRKECNLAFCNNVDGARRYDAKWNKSIRERQMPYDFSPMRNLWNKTNEQRKK